MNDEENGDIFAEIELPRTLRLTDHAASSKLRDFCFSMWMEVQTLQSCIALFDHSNAIVTSIFTEAMSTKGEINEENERNRRLTSKWPFIAAREALSALYNFHWSLRETNSFVQSLPDQVNEATREGVQGAFEKFERKFDKALLARHAASHRSEILNSFEKNAHKAGLSGPHISKAKGTSAIISGNLMDRTYTETRRGELLKFEVTWETYSIVLEIYKTVIDLVKD